MSSTGPRSQRMDKAIIRGPMDVSPLSDDVTEILPNLFLGSEAGARNLEMLRKRGITHILTVMVDPVPRGATAAEDGFRRMQIPVQDWPDQELMTYFKDANNFIDAARVTAQEAVLVHCYQGVSRSATIVAAYLMASHPPLHDDDSAALAFLRARRPIVHPNSGFLAQLALYGRCGCDLDAHPTAVEAWRAGAGRMRTWRVAQVKRGDSTVEAKTERMRVRKVEWVMCTLM